MREPRKGVSKEAVLEAGHYLARGRALASRKGFQNSLGPSRKDQRDYTKSPGLMGQTPLPLGLRASICEKGIANY